MQKLPIITIHKCEHPMNQNTDKELQIQKQFNIDGQTGYAIQNA